MPSRSSRGSVRPDVLMEAMPLLVVEEEGRLNDPLLRESFVVRVFTHHRWRQLTRDRRPPGPPRGLPRPAQAPPDGAQRASPPRARTAGRRARTESPAELGEQYAEGLFAGLRVKATTRKHTNVLQHVAGYLREPLDRRDRDELHGTIADYHRGLVPLIVPLTLLRHYVGKFGARLPPGSGLPRPAPEGAHAPEPRLMRPGCRPLAARPALERQADPGRRGLRPVLDDRARGGSAGTSPWTARSSWVRELGKPLVILEALRAGYPWASDRLHRFVLDGMADTARRLRGTGVAYYPYVEPARGAGKGLLARPGGAAPPSA